MVDCHEVLKKLYHEIYQLHWSYLELEDGMQKLEEQKLLENLLKKFLCVVPHNRKFFLPETFSVFRRTVTQMKDFSIVKMLNGFESISQYANNLFTKPWRKEYRTIKMYSGFFIHEIKSNLIDPEELFVAMGYRWQNQELVLDGEICPDQVMNMSRDAMTAYAECKIMHRIYSDLTTTYKIACTWQDVFSYREEYTGGVTETIGAILSVIQQQSAPVLSSALTCSQREAHNPLSAPRGNNPNIGVPLLQPVPMNQATMNYSSPIYHQHLQFPSEFVQNNYSGTSGPQNTNYYHQMNPQNVLVPATIVHNACSGAAYGTQYCVTNTPVDPGINGIVPNSFLNTMQMLPHAQQDLASKQNYSFDHRPTPSGGPTLPHSKSMDHYSCRNSSLDVQPCHNMHPYDQKGPLTRSQGNVNEEYCERTYVERTPTAYNVSGTRYPLPFTISKQFNPMSEMTTSSGLVCQREAILNSTRGLFSDKMNEVSFDTKQQQRVLGANGHVQGEPEQHVGFYSQLPAGPTTEHVSFVCSDEIDMFGSARKTKRADPTRSSDFDSYEELFGIGRMRTLSDTDKIRDGVGSFEAWDYVYQALDATPEGKHAGQANQETLSVPKGTINNKTSSTQEASKIREQDLHLRAVKDITRESDRRERRSKVNHKKANSVGGNPQGAVGTRTLINGSHHKQVSDSVVILKSGVESSMADTNSGDAGSQFHLESLPPPLSTTGQTEWSCMFCTYLNESSQSICEMCAKSRDFILQGAASSATCV